MGNLDNKNRRQHEILSDRLKEVLGGKQPANLSTEAASLQFKLHPVLTDYLLSPIVPKFSQMGVSSTQSFSPPSNAITPAHLEFASL